jgi:hypothetical protein
MDFEGAEADCPLSSTGEEESSNPRSTLAHWDYS